MTQRTKMYRNFCNLLESQCICDTDPLIGDRLRGVKAESMAADHTEKPWLDEADPDDSTQQDRLEPTPEAPVCMVVTHTAIAHRADRGRVASTEVLSPSANYDTAGEKNLRQQPLP